MNFRCRPSELLQRDDRTFLGVRAQELAKDKHWSKAVSHGRDGSPRVDYAMHAAGEAAAVR